MSAHLKVRLKPKTLDALGRLAERTERSRSWLIAKAVEDYVQLHSWQIERIKVGLEEADAGEFASEAEVARVLGKFM